MSAQLFQPAHCLLLAAALFALGCFGVLARRNLLVVLMSLEIMLNAAALALATFARVLSEDQAGAGQVFVLLVMAVAAAEAGVGLALIMALYRQRGSVDERALTGMEG